jgi:hypothetical protein
VRPRPRLHHIYVVLSWTPSQVPCTSLNDSDTLVCLNTSHWDSLYAMATKSGNDIIFGLSFDMVKACADEGASVFGLVLWLVLAVWL